MELQFQNEDPKEADKTGAKAAANVSGNNNKKSEDIK